MAAITLRAGNHVVTVAGVPGSTCKAFDDLVADRRAEEALAFADHIS
ncbi:hypothetical protein [Methylobacterium gnaphalii]|nr:hypothetical protein [Methylobacterium gnaphalii]